jgi:hypothetical protein
LNGVGFQGCVRKGQEVFREGGRRISLGKGWGIAVEVGPGVEGSVTTTFTDEPLEKAIERMLEAAGAKNFAAQFDMEQATARLQKASWPP